MCAASMSVASEAQADQRHQLHIIFYPCVLSVIFSSSDEIGIFEIKKVKLSRISFESIRGREISRIDKRKASFLSEEFFWADSFPSMA